MSSAKRNPHKVSNTLVVWHITKFECKSYGKDAVRHPWVVAKSQRSLFKEINMRWLDWAAACLILYWSPWVLGKAGLYLPRFPVVLLKKADIAVRQALSQPLIARVRCVLLDTPFVKSDEPRPPASSTFLTYRTMISSLQLLSLPLRSLRRNLSAASINKPRFADSEWVFNPRHRVFRLRFDIHSESPNLLNSTCTSSISPYT